MSTAAEAARLFARGGHIERWSDLAVRFDSLLIGYAGMALTAVASLIVAPPSPVGIPLVMGALFLACLGRIIVVRTQADHCRQWAEFWQAPDVLPLP